MAACQQTGDSELYCLALSYNDFTNLIRESLNVIGHSLTICGNIVFRKHDAGGMSFGLVTFAVAPVFVSESDKSSFSAYCSDRVAGSLGFSLCVRYVVLVLVIVAPE
jgi:hypothetical protein